VLVSTAFGAGWRGSRPSLPFLVRLLWHARRTGDPETDVRNGFKFFTTPPWYQAHPDIVNQYVAWRVAHPQPAAPYQRQGQAAKEYNSESRVAQIAAPTLIVHGRQDRLVPVQNAQRLAGKIPQAEVVLLNAGHACMIEQDHQFNEAVIRFLQAA
jgi:pimeloyl-ACP methyl ester carboxylesterase